MTPARPSSVDATRRAACRAALERLGVRRIAVLSPYPPIADGNVTGFFEEAGFTVVRLKGLHRPTATSIAEVGEAQLRNVQGLATPAEIRPKSC